MYRHLVTLLCCPSNKSDHSDHMTHTATLEAREFMEEICGILGLDLCSEVSRTWQGCPMDDNGDAFPGLGHAAFCRDVNAQVASDCFAYWVVFNFCNFLCRVAGAPLNLFSSNLKIWVWTYLCICDCTQHLHGYGEKWEWNLFLNTGVLEWQKF